MTGRQRARLFTFAIALGIAVAISPASAAQPAQSLPALSAPVNDFANVIDPATETDLDKRIRALQGASGDSVVVVTVETFAPYGSIEEFAVRLFEQAGIGTRVKDNGVLVVLAVKDRKVRIETGYGLEEFITDGFAGETIRQVMLPAFREGRYGPGLLAGATRVIQRIAERRGITLPELPPATEARRLQPIVPMWVVPVAFVALLLLLRALERRQGQSPFRRRRRGGTWSGWHGGIGGFGGGGFGGGFGGFGGGGGGGGFGGFGGGRSGGGGASGGW